MARGRQPKTTLTFPVMLSTGQPHGPNWFVDFDPETHDLLIQTNSPATGQIRNVARLTAAGNLILRGTVTAPGVP